MFTGIIQGTAELFFIKEKDHNRTHVIKMPQVLLSGIEIGASVAHDGCCLTVTDITGDHVSFDLISETISLTTLGSLLVGDKVNVERAAKFSDEIGGHIVSGHITTTAKILKVYNIKNTYTIFLQLLKANQKKYVFYKGFITIDGISLTVGEVKQDIFCVHLIPETLVRTTIGSKNIGDRVNIEIDLHTKVITDTVERVLERYKINSIIQH
ncbi:riboflavin synthase subunit alpha [Candidatus Erwinia haradaeae]|uniref:Riboflavin synthase n=1 Tax=Candidatus Erwinia haradaeae TaxID=1922217 RepID=A0A451D3N2_9GAMM|nr:riboflavin synthase subunit alpha [Candidatus Erwinia haradaeae]VFP80275.1 Riboflavin synthase [Candidatus Erwinia haradaeae]